MLQHTERNIERLIKENFKYSFSICKKFTKNIDEAELLRSQVFEKIWKSRNRFQGTDADFKNWLYIIIKNAYISKYRDDKKRWGDLSLEDEFRHPTIDSFDENPDHKNLLKNINYTIDSSFSYRDAKIFKMNTYEGYKYIEISAFFKIPLGTVKLVIHKIRKYLHNKRNIKSLPADNP